MLVVIFIEELCSKSEGKVNSVHLNKKLFLFL